MKRMIDEKLIELVKTLSLEDVAFLKQFEEFFAYNEETGIMSFDGELYPNALTTDYLRLPVGITSIVNDDDEPLFPSSFGTKLYKHSIVFNTSESCIAISTDDTEITTSNFGVKLRSALKILYDDGVAYFDGINICNCIVGNSYLEVNSSATITTINSDNVEEL